MFPSYMLQCLYNLKHLVGAAYIVLHPTYNTPQYRWARTTVFLGLGFTGIFPVSHAFYIHGPIDIHYEMGMSWLLASCALYAIGALL
jgi:adiponectin receptor